MANAYVKMEEKRLQNPGADKGEQRDEIDVILASPFDPDKKEQLLFDALERLEVRCRRIREILNEAHSQEVIE